jgi:hypothetical protein
MPPIATPAAAIKAANVVVWMPKYPRMPTTSKTFRVTVTIEPSSATQSDQPSASPAPREPCPTAIPINQRPTHPEGNGCQDLETHIGHRRHDQILITRNILFSHHFLQ